MLEEWKNWCRLCAKENSNEINVLKDEQMIYLSKAIFKFLSIEIMETDFAPTSICFDCYKLMSEVVAFSERSGKVQSMYTQIKIKKECDVFWLDLNAIKSEFGLSTKLSSKYKNQLTDTSDLHEIFNQNHIGLDSEFLEDEVQINTFHVGGKIDDDEGRDEVDCLNENILHIDHVYECDESKDGELNKSESNNSYYFQYKCEICFKEFQHEQNYKRHLKLNHFLGKCKTNDNKFQCHICDKNFMTKNQLKNHKNVHLSDDNKFQYPCSLCDKSFSTKTRLKSHYGIHIPDDRKTQYPCPFCAKIFTKRNNLQLHVRGKHDNNKPYICEECGKAFTKSGALKEHKYTHVDDTPYECPKCQKQFKNKARLKTHIDTHNDTAYVCTTCGLQLNTRRTLLMHMVVHSDQKKYKCNFCGNEYKRSKALKNHLILHTGLRPYSCPFCDKTFANGSNCRSHKKKSHPQELAALEASGQKTKITNIPKLEQLKSVATVDAKLRAVQPDNQQLNDSLIQSNNSNLNIGESNEMCIEDQQKSISSCF